MNRLVLIRALIEEHIEEFEWLLSFDIVIAEIEDNFDTKPDISIEACKSLFESIAKNILRQLDIQYNPEKIDSFDVVQLVKKANSILQERNKHSDASLTERFNTVLCSAFQRVVEIRNERGDISHGKVFPKKYQSSIYLARSIVHFTDSFASYLLHLLLTAEPLYPKELEFDDNTDFNDDLDLNNPDSIIRYSRALFDQDQIVYEEQLADFRAAQEDAIERENERIAMEAEQAEFN